MRLQSNTIALFPGQGSQYVGMCQTLFEHFPGVVEPIYEEASSLIGIDLKRLCQEGPEAELKLTENTQPALLCHSYATFQVLKKELGIEFNYYAGHSLGEYSALVASGKLDFASALTTVKQRGKAMQQAVPPGEGGMAAVLGLEANEIHQVASDISRQAHLIVEIANDNCPGQIVVAGNKAGLMALEEALSKPRVKFIHLPVSAPFHCSLMAPAAKTMAPILGSLAWQVNDKKIIANVDAHVYGSNYSSQLLVKQIDHPVLWTQTLTQLQGCGLVQAIEIGPGRVLSGLIKRTLGPSFSVHVTDKVTEFLASSSF